MGCPASAPIFQRSLALSGLDVKAFRLFSYAYDKGSRWGVFYMAKCCFNGWGTTQSYSMTLRYLDEMNWEYWEADYLRNFPITSLYPGRSKSLPDCLSEYTLLSGMPH